jgi:hypothetical protein
MKNSLQNNMIAIIAMIAVAAMPQRQVWRRSRRKRPHTNLPLQQPPQWGMCRKSGSSQARPSR